MNIACEKCKYDNYGQCEFYVMGSGNDIDMSCYQEKELIKEAADDFLQALVDAESEEYGDIVKETDNQIKYVIAQTYSPVDFCTYGRCPICGETVSGFSIGNPNLCDEECPKCGQKLKWR